MTTNLNEVKFMSETEFGKLTNTDDDKLYLVKSPGAQLVETWKSSDGTSWYRKWSDGWIEQGGECAGGSNSRTVTLHTAFTNTAYRVQVTLRSDSGSNYSPGTAITNSSSFKICTDGEGANSATASWYAYGK